MSNSIVGHRQASVPSVPAPQPTDLSNILGRISSLIDEVQKDGETLYQLANRVVGSAPEGSGDARSGLEAVPNGAIQQINEALDSLYQRVLNNRDIVRRLENLA